MTSLARSQLSSLDLERERLPFELTPTMREWLHSKVPSRGEEIFRVERLVAALLDERGLAVKYRREPTRTAADVFEERQANCLSFTHLFVGMAREVGLPVYFLEVRDVENYDREGDLVVHSDHIAVGLGPSHNLTIIDFAMQQNIAYRRVRAISDREAIALFYSNRGAEELRQGANEAARSWLEDAVKIAPSSTGSWVNLGVARRRTGDAAGAERAYRAALEIDPAETAAYQNLAALLRLQGNEEEALALIELTDRSSNRNPFTYLALGDLSRRHGRVEEAERFYRRAIRVQSENAEPLAAMGLLSFDLGDRRTAERMLRKASKLDAEAPRVLELRERLEDGS